jgi:hypothetical protein
VAAVLAAGASAESALQAGSPPMLPGGCTDSAPCRYPAGTYRLGALGVIPGLRMTLPHGWSSTGNDEGELSLTPPGHPNDRVFVWVDMVAVKSSGPGHGTTVLTSVGKTPAGLVSWLTSNRDFLVVSPPRQATVLRGVRGTMLTIGVSGSAKYGDHGCPSNPRCADLFTSPRWLRSDFYGIAAPEVARISLATATIGRVRHTVFVVLDAPSRQALTKLAALARPVTSSLRLR